MFNLYRNDNFSYLKYFELTTAIKMCLWKSDSLHCVNFCHVHSRIVKRLKTTKEFDPFYSLHYSISYVRLFRNSSKEFFRFERFSAFLRFFNVIYVGLFVLFNKHYNYKEVIFFILKKNFIWIIDLVIFLTEANKLKIY